MSTSPESKQASKLSSPWGAVSVAFEIGYVIAIPAAVFGFIGAHFDKQMETSFVFTAIGFLLAFCVSAFIVTKRVKMLTKNMI